MTISSMQLVSKVTALCLFDRSSAFDTIDHSILIEHLTSWFGLNGVVLLWIQSYLSSRLFKVTLNGNKPPIYQLFMVFPKVLFLVLFFSHYTPLHSALSILTPLEITIFMLIILNSSSLSPLLILPQIYFFFKILFPMSLPGCLPICYLLFTQKLNFSYLVFPNSSQKFLFL
jgi:hypothetical protein